MNAVVLSESLAKAAGEFGAALAASHANRIHDEWSDDAMQLFRLYAAQHPEGFLTEEVRRWADKLGFPEPPDNRAWGSVARRASTLGYVKSTGVRRQASTTCHGSMKTVWRQI